jgi:Tfp pilus assembly protein PilF
MAARKLITESLTRNKSHGSGWLIAAEIEMDCGNDGLVSLLLRRGIECAPNDAELYNKLGSVLVGKGQLMNVSCFITIANCKALLG